MTNKMVIGKFDFKSLIGTNLHTKTDEFSEKFRRDGGGEVISNPKINVAKF